MNNNNNCPSKMSDGRSFTDYRPRCSVNAELFDNVSQNNQIKSSYESRMFLQRNADTIIEANRNNAVFKLAPCAPCKRDFNDAGTMHPERYVVKCDATSCYRQEINPNGLGDGRSY
jgi:hypothetical protein